MGPFSFWRPLNATTAPRMFYPCSIPPEPEPRNPHPINIAACAPGIDGFRMCVDGRLVNLFSVIFIASLANHELTAYLVFVGLMTT